MNIFKTSKAELSGFLFSIPLVIALVFIKSPISYDYGLSFKIYSLFYSLIFLLLIFTYKKNISYFVLYFSLINLITICAVAFYHSDLKIIYSGATIVLGILVFSVVDKSLFLKVVNLSSFIIFILLIGAWFTFIDTIFNGFPENYYIFANEREVYQGKFSFGDKMSSAISGKHYFRPSSIYDESGSLSLVIVFIVALRNAFNMNERNSYIILGLGFITFSIAHLIFTIFYFLYKISLKKIFYFFVLLILTIYFISYVEIPINEAFKTFLQRFTLSSPEEGFIKGNNRYFYLIRSIEFLQNFNYQELLFGEPGTSNCCQPLEPLINYGLLGSWPYYFILGLFIYYSFKRKNIIAIAIVLTLMQRPEVQSAGTAFLVAALLIAYRIKPAQPK